MLTHVKVLAVLYIVLGALGVLGAVTGKDQISMFKMTSAVNKHIS